MRISDWSSDVCSSDLTWNILCHASGSNASSLTAFRPFGSNQRVDSVEKRADRSSNLSSGAKARALIVAADRVATRSSGASAISTCAKPSSATTARKNSQRRLRDSPSRSEEHTSELQSLIRHSYAVFCLKKKKTT